MTLPPPMAKQCIPARSRQASKRPAEVNGPSSTLGSFSAFARAMNEPAAVLRQRRDMAAVLAGNRPSRYYPHNYPTTASSSFILYLYLNPQFYFRTRTSISRGYPQEKTETRHAMGSGKCSAERTSCAIALSSVWVDAAGRRAYPDIDMLAPDPLGGRLGCDRVAVGWEVCGISPCPRERGGPSRNRSS